MSITTSPPPRAPSLWSRPLFSGQGRKFPRRAFERPLSRGLRFPGRRPGARRRSASAGSGDPSRGVGGSMGSSPREAGFTLEARNSRVSARLTPADRPGRALRFPSGSRQDCALHPYASKSHLRDRCFVAMLRRSIRILFDREKPPSNPNLSFVRCGKGEGCAAWAVNLCPRTPLDGTKRGCQRTPAAILTLR